MRGYVASVRIAVFVSGSGTLLEAILEAEVPVELIVADRECRALTLDSIGGIPTVLVERVSFGDSFDRDAYSEQIVDLLISHRIDVVAMAGFGTILGEAVFEALPGRIINTHPALLPAFPGWHAVRDAMAAGVKVTGCTIHVATPVVDHGPILAQEAVKVLAIDDEASLHERIKIVERWLYVDTLRTIAQSGEVLGTPI